MDDKLKKKAKIQHFNIPNVSEATLDYLAHRSWGKPYNRLDKMETYQVD